MSFEVSAKSLISDISENQIKIDARFTGKNLLLFGTRNDSGDIVIVIRGPQKDYSVRKKERIAGVWIAGKQIKFENIYSNYAVYSSKPLVEIGTDNILKQLNIGLQNIRMDYVGSPDLYELNAFREALQNDIRKNNLYWENNKKVEFMGDTLFKASINFPKKIPNGTHIVEVYLIDNGKIQGMQARPIIAEKVGFEAFIHNFAYHDPLIYGIIAVLSSLLLGWVANIIFWKV